MRYDLAPDRLTFIFEISARNSHAELHIEDLKLYLMDDSNNIHNAELVLLETFAKAGSKAHALSGYIHTAFNPAFLFQGLRIAVYHQPNGNIEIIDLKHQLK